MNPKIEKICVKISEYKNGFFSLIDLYFDKYADIYPIGIDIININIEFNNKLPFLVFSMHILYIFFYLLSSNSFVICNSFLLSFIFLFN